MNPKETRFLIDLYKLHAELAERIDSSREGQNKIYASMVASIVAVSVLLFKYLPEVEMIWGLPLLGTFVSLSWMFSLHSLTRKLSAKHKVLVDLEKKLPFQFFEQENIEFEKGGFLRRKHTALIMPISFLFISAISFAVMITKSWCPS